MRDTQTMNQAKRPAVLASTMFAALLLAGCGSADDRTPEPEPTIGAEQPQNSIIRPDVEQPEAPPLAPLDARISFALEDVELSEPMQAELATIARSPQMRAGGPITLRAHTDSRGSDEEALERSQEMGEIVRDWLVENGVDEERITVIAFGEQNPLRPNAKPDGTANDAGRAINRRVDLNIAVPDAQAMEEETPSLIEEFSNPEPTATPTGAVTR